MEPPAIAACIGIAYCTASFSAHTPIPLSSSSSEHLACWSGRGKLSIASGRHGCRHYPVSLYLIWRKLLSFAPDKFKPGNLECEIIKVLAPLAACVVLRKQSAAAISTQQNAYYDMPSTNQRLRVQGSFFGPSTCVFYVAAYIRVHFSAYLFVAC
jgi:hypothetical protein